MHRRLAASITAALFTGIGLAIAFCPPAYSPIWEGRYYLAAANGDHTHMESFYAGRILHPMVVRLVARAAHVSIDWRAFLWVSIASLILLCGVLGVYFGLEFREQPWIFVPLIATATVIDQYRNYYWHDLFYAALCAVFFLILRANRWAALPVLLLLYLTRESTVVLVATLVIVPALRRDWLFSLSSLAVGVAGFATTGALVARALPEHNGIPVLLEDLLKVPYSFALNVCGIELWSNTDAATIGHAPKWVANLPGWLHLGHIHQIGYCGFFWQRPAALLVLLASSFGVLPLLIWPAIVARRRRNLFKRFDYAIALTYGGLMFLLTPLIGTLPMRYALYAWPAFWIFGVAFMYVAFPDSRTRVQYILLSVLAAWVPASVRYLSGQRLEVPGSLVELSSTSLIVSMAILAALYFAAYRVIKRSHAGVRIPSGLAPAQQ